MCPTSDIIYDSMEVIFLPTYVKGHDKDTWHWCKNCSKYPQTIAKTTTVREWDLCEECKDKEKLKTCQE